MVLSLNRGFGTDIDNYAEYFRDLDSDVTASSLEPLYIATAQILHACGFDRLATLDLVVALSLGLTAGYCARQKHPVATLVIALSWLLLQQFWGTVRTGLGICLLLYCNRAFVQSGRIPWQTFLAPLFHWSLLVHPFALLARFGLRLSVLVAVGTYVGVAAVGSIRGLFFTLIPAELEAIANYAALQTEALAQLPPITPILMHAVTAWSLSRVCTREELPRFLGPLTVLVAANCLFFDFDQVGTRVANVLLSVKILALVRIYDGADHLPGGRYAARPLILLYCIAVAGQYYAANIEYFR